MFILAEVLLALVAVGFWLLFGILPALAVAIVGAIVSLRLARR